MFVHRAVRSGAAGAAGAAPLFVAKFVIIARVHSLLSGATLKIWTHSECVGSSKLKPLVYKTSNARNRRGKC